MDVSPPHPDLSRILPAPLAQRLPSRNQALADGLQVPAGTAAPDFFTAVQHEDWGKPGDASFQSDLVHRLAQRMRDVFAQAPRRSQAVHKPDPLQAQELLDAAPWQRPPANRSLPAGHPLLAQLPKPDTEA